MKKRLFFKCKLNFGILFYHLEKAIKIVFLNLSFKNFVIVLVANMLIKYVKYHNFHNCELDEITVLYAVIIIVF